ncbi:MAG: hypothetical protein ABIQ59_08990 [Nocardioidaceae bacterium]
MAAPTVPSRLARSWPTVALALTWGRDLGPVPVVLLTLTVVVSILTVIPGRATRLQAAVHLILSVSP